MYNYKRFVSVDSSFNVMKHIIRLIYFRVRSGSGFDFSSANTLNGRKTTKSNISNFIYNDHFLLFYWKIDVEMAENRENIPGWGNFTNHRVSHVDHITSTSEKTKIWSLLLHTPFVHHLHHILLVSYWRPSFLHGLPCNFSVRHREVT